MSLSSYSMEHNYNHSFLFLMFVFRNLHVLIGIFSVSVSWLQLIMPPLRLMGLIIVTVPLMKEPLFKKKVVKDTPVLISQLRNPISLEHLNISIYLEHVFSLPLV